MRVLQINSVCGIGSTGRIATDIHNVLIEQGHESYIAYGRDEPQNCDTAIKIGTNFNNYSHVALTRIYDKHGFGSKKVTREFIKEVERINPDIIHLHNIHGYYINIEILFEYLKKTDKQVIWTLHDCWSFTGHCSHFDFIGCNKWETGCFKCPQKREYPTSLMLDNSENNYLAKKELFKGVKNLTIVTPSEWLASKVSSSFLNEYSIKVINNGVNLSVFKPSESELRYIHDIERKFIILGVAGSWEERKGFDIFKKLSNLLSKDEAILLVGVTEKQKASLPINIIGITKTNNVGDLARFYSAADVFVNPTLEDNFPTTNLESLACGTPVITFNTGGSAESVDESCGLIVDHGNLEELLEKVRYVKMLGKSTYSQNAIDRAWKFYHDKNRYQDYIDIYDNIY